MQIILRFCLVEKDELQTSLQTNLDDKTDSNFVGLKPGLIILLAIATGVSVANTYYVQPLLHELEITFRSNVALTSLAVTATQVGYALGLLFLVPMGDIISRKVLTGVVSIIAVGGLIAGSIAGSIELFELASILVGFASVVTHIIIPFAADHAPEEKRGQTVGQVMSGLLAGILISRGFSGVIAELFGWRSVYLAAALFMLAIGFALIIFMPNEFRGTKPKYTQLILSTWRLFFSEPILRRRALLGAASFGTFSVLWTSLTYLLSSSPYHYPVVIIGLFSVVGLSGIIVANVAGKFVDKGKHDLFTFLSAMELLLAFVLLLLGRISIIWVVIGIIVLDAATQGMQITNQGVIFSIDEKARSRINSSYMFCYFLGASVGSLLSGFCYARFGWTGVCTLGLIGGIVALLGSIIPIKTSFKS